MSLHTQASKLTTSWRDLIQKLVKEDSHLERWYAEEIAKFGEILPMYPKKENIFRCFDYFDIADTKVVILGQDPYHGPGQATGLCFGVNTNQKVPPSLRNIMKKLQNSKSTTTTTLEQWAEQGVLLLNTSLTVRHKTPASHMKHWCDFTTKVIDHLNRNYTGIVFVAWGAFAHRRLEKVSNKHHLIVSSHPSPLSYSRRYRIYPSFKDATPFMDINKKLSSSSIIQW